MSGESVTVAIAGHPNSGKTSLFNAITALRQHTANYPGVTVERKEGTCRYKGHLLRVVDLPGTYSLTAFSNEELLARDYILQHHPDVVVVTIDSSNVERNLYLATQLLELGVPLVLAFNMADRAEAAGLRIDHGRLSALLGVPIATTVASRGKGIDELLAGIIQVAQAGPAAVAAQRRVDYGKDIEPAIAKLSELLGGDGSTSPSTRWLAVKLLENDDQVAARIRLDGRGDAQAILDEAARARQHIEAISGDASELVLAARRYGSIAGACAKTVTAVAAARQVASDRIDAVVTNRYLGLPIFAVAMLIVFQLTFWLGNPMAGWLESGKDALAAMIHRMGDGLLVSLLADGVVEGMGAVVQFVPLIALVFVAIAVLEDSGYMARAAFVLDRLMHRVGLHGKSFIPMLIGFGCTVPAVLATRMLEGRRNRLTTMMVLPLMSCGARLPVYVLMLGAFFSNQVMFRLFGVIPVTDQAMLLLVIYAIGMVLAILLARLLRSTIFHGEGGEFVMELPAYHMPTLRGVALHAWQRTWMYLRKAGTVILAMAIILWALKTWPALDAGRRAEFQAQREAAAAGAAAPGRQHVDELIQRIDLAEHRAGLEHAAVGRIGHALEPVLRPCGFDWKIASALIGSLAAKEVFVSQMGVIYAVGAHGQEQSLRSKLAADYTALQGFCIMLFCLISAPCIGTVAVTLRESGSWKWAALQWGGLTALAWAAATVVYQVGRAALPLLGG